VIEYEDSSVTVPGDQFTIGVQSTMTVGNAGSGLTHRLYYSIGTVLNAPLDGGVQIAAGSPVNWTPAATLANQITTDMVGDVTLTLGNYLSGVLQSTVLLTFPLNVPASYVPTISTGTPPAFALQNPVGDTIGVYVQNRSWTKCTITASSVYGATIAEYRLTIDGVTTTSASNIITTGVLAQYGAKAATVVVVDTRGQTATWSTASAMTVYEYFAPMVTAFSLLRCDAGGVASNVGTYMKYVLSVVFAPINNLNTRGGTIKFKVAGGAYGAPVALNTITGYSATVSGVIGGGGITSSGYVAAVGLTDKYNSGSVLTEASLPSSKLWFDLHSSGEGMAIGKAATEASIFDVGIDSKFREEATFEKTPTFQAAPAFSQRAATLLALGIQTGNVATTMPNNTSKTGTVTFPVPYASVPLVFLQFFGSASTYDRPLKYVVQAVSETSFTWMLSYASSSGGAVSIYWLAIGDLT
jgi:hypothetical protein